MTRRIRVVAAVIVRGDCVFAARRAPHKSQGGLWEFPGGKVEPGESDREALAREIDEELGMTVRVGEHVGTSVHDYGAVEVELVAHACVWTGGEAVPTDHDAIRWVDAAGFAELDWAPADVPLLEPVSALLHRGG